MPSTLNIAQPVASITPYVNNDTMPVAPQLYSFMYAIQRKMPDIKFGRMPAKNSTMFQNEMLAYVDGEVYVRGALGYGSLAVHGGGQRKYYVMSHNIANNSYSVTRFQHNTKASVKREQGVKLAKTHFIRLPTIKAMEHCAMAFERKHDSYHNEVSGDAVEAFREFTASIGSPDGILLTDLHELASGKEMSPVLRSAMKSYSEAAVKWREVKSENLSLTFVTVAKLNDVITCNVLPVYRRALGPIFWRARAQEAAVPNLHLEQVYSQHDLPEVLIEKLSVLNILNDGDHLPGIGMKVSPQAFFIYNWITAEEVL